MGLPEKDPQKAEMCLEGGGMQIHVVKPGDTIDKIAESYNVAPERLIYDNQLVYPYALAVGQALLIQDTERQAGKSVFSGGYAYPFISPWVLAETLPYLSELYVFSYGFSSDGELIPPVLPDEWMIRAARESGVLPILTLTSFGADGNFNNRLISAVVRNPAARSRLLGDLVSVMGEKGYGGLDIDFEYILAEDRDAFSEFVRICAAVMHGAGYQISVALAPKTSADQPGLLHEGKDYGAIGEAADYVLLMTYEWGYKYGPPMAVAPLDKVRQVVEYAVTEIPSGKIRLGIPNYGYDWPLPFVQGETRARTIGNIEAVGIAVETGSEILFSEMARSPYFTYTAQNGVPHEVWFEDVRSLQGKFDLMDEFGLSGCTWWQIMQLFRPGWLLLWNRYQVLKS